MTEKQLLQKLGMKIKQLRTEKGISQNTFGFDIEMEKSNVSRLESGKTNPRISTLFRVSKALNISLAELLKLD